MNREQRRSAEREANRMSKTNRNRCWDDLNGIYAECLELLRKHVYVKRLAEQPALRERLTDPSTVARNIEIMSRDVKTLTDKLAAINAKHRGKTGGSNDPDVCMTSIQIYEEYSNFMAEHESVVMPIVYHIIEAYGEAEKRYYEEKRQLEQQSPVEVIENTTNVQL